MVRADAGHDLTPSSRIAVMSRGTQCCSDSQAETGEIVNRSISLVAASLCGWTCSAHAQDTLSAQWATQWNAKNLAAVMELYAPRPAFLPTIGPRWAGTDNIRKNFSGLLTTYDPHISLRSIASENSGELAYDSGTYDETITPVKGGKPIASKGSYLFLFQRQPDGSWKILEQTWTSDGPPPKL
jgi:uncharacterized protein (TIGR02246 family)